MHQLVFTDKAKTQLEALSGKIRLQVEKGLDRIAANPQVGKPLRGELKGILSERVATFRILYKIVGLRIEVLILVIEHRRSVYGGH